MFTFTLPLTCIRSRVHFDSEFSQRTRMQSATALRRRRDRIREERRYGEMRLSARQMVESAGRGSPPKTASVASCAADVRHIANVDGGMAGILLKG